MFILLLVVLKRQWYVLIYSLFTISVVAGSLYVYYPDSMINFLTTVAPENGDVFRTYFGNFSFNGFVGRLFNGTAGITALFSPGEAELLFRYSGITLIVFLSIIFALKVNNYDLCLSVHLIVMLIISPTTWAHSFVILLLPGFVILRHLYTQGNWFYKSFFIIVVILSCIPHWQYYEWLRSISPAQPLPSWLLFTSPGFYVLIGMLILTVLQGIKHYSQQFEAVGLAAAPIGSNH